MYYPPIAFFSTLICHISPLHSYHLFHSSSHWPPHLSPNTAPYGTLTECPPMDYPLNSKMRMECPLDIPYIRDILTPICNVPWFYIQPCPSVDVLSHVTSFPTPFTWFVTFLSICDIFPVCFLTPLSHTETYFLSFSCSTFPFPWHFCPRVNNFHLIWRWLACCVP
jgi:hypothetical protein